MSSRSKYLYSLVNTPSLCPCELFAMRSKISDVGFIEVSPPFHSSILDVTN